MTTSHLLKAVIREDMSDIVQAASKLSNTQLKVVGYNIDTNDVNLDKVTTLTPVTLSLHVSDGKTHKIIKCTYGVDDQHVYTDFDIQDVSKSLANKFVTATSNFNRNSAIYAADDELLDAPTDLDEAVDDLADTVEDVQDQIDDIDEDEPTIEINNNIDGHYIAECERCHEIFISAVMESDQEIDHVSGICPLCGKDTNQYLKWVIKAVENN